MRWGGRKFVEAWERINVAIGEGVKVKHPNAAYNVVTLSMRVTGPATCALIKDVVTTDKFVKRVKRR